VEQQRGRSGTLPAADEHAAVDRNLERLHLHRPILTG
jgi:hypothetical protein